jgi:hypothetical protein
MTSRVCTEPALSAAERSPRPGYPALDRGRLVSSGSVDARALRPLRIGEVLDVAIKIYLRNARTMFKIVFVVVAPVQLLTMLILASTTPDPDLISPTFETPQPGEVPVFETSDLWGFFAGLLTTWLLSWIATTIATGACYKTIGGAYLGEAPEWRESLRFARSRLRPLLWLTFIQAVLTGLGFVACIIPGIWLAVSWAVAVPAMLTEDVRGRAALGRSFRLVRHRWWPTLGTLALGFILAAILGGAITGAVTALSFTDVNDSLLATLLVEAIAGTISGVLVTPFQAALATIIYFDLRVRKEGFDLELLAQHVGVPVPEGGRPTLIPPEPQPSAQPPFWPPPPGWKPQEPPDSP